VIFFTYSRALIVVINYLKSLHPALRPMFPMATYTSREPMDVLTEESNFRHTNYPQSLERLILKTISGYLGADMV